MGTERDQSLKHETPDEPGEKSRSGVIWGWADAWHGDTDAKEPGDLLERLSKLRPGTPDGGF